MRIRYGQSVELVNKRSQVRLLLTLVRLAQQPKTNCSHPCASVTKQYKFVPVQKLRLMAGYGIGVAYCPASTTSSVSSLPI